MFHAATLFPAFPATQPKPVALAIRAWVLGGLVAAALPAWAELPVPADILVAPGNGVVLPPQISGNTMTIRQQSDKATLDWKSFNIGEGHAVEFIQPAATSVALNKIHQSDPSRIMGSLTANGQVYLINQNGFVFGKNSQVNVNSLVASALDISDDVFKRGITKVFDQDGAAALEGKQGIYLKDDQGNPVLDANGQKVKIQIFVEKGAQIATNASGGRVILAAPSINQQGTIKTPDGQAILAASADKVYLQEADPDSDLRGLLVEVETGGDVNNVGTVLAERGNASLIGFAVNQRGIVSATTSVNVNGSVRLLAREGHLDPSASLGVLTARSSKRLADNGDGLGTQATVNLGENSLTSVELDANKGQTAIDGQPQSRSQIDIAGHQIALRSQATVSAQAGVVNVTAKDLEDTTGTANASRIYLDSGSRIDVSGVNNVRMPMERNVAQVELRLNELRDSPLQRDGILYAKKVNVDIRDATLSYNDDGQLASAKIPIADITGAISRILRNIDERSTAGGSINLQSSGDVIVKPGATLDFSGGSVAYAGGNISTTKLMDAEGHVYDIGKADPNRQYTSIFGQWVKQWTQWGITEVWSLPGPFSSGRYEAGYIDGKAAGTLNITAFSAMLDGILNGRRIDGERQRQPGQRASGSQMIVTVGLDPVKNAAQQTVLFQDGGGAAIGLNDLFPTVEQDGEKIPAPLTLDTNLLKQSGVANATFSTGGKVSIGAGARVETVLDGSLTLNGGDIDVQGQIIAPAGHITLAASQPAGPGSAASGSVTLGKTAVLQARGQWANDMLARALGSGASPAQTPVSIAGGSVSLRASEGDLQLAQGSQIDVGGGAWLQANGKISAGQGGNIALRADGLNGASIILDGDLRGYALEQGGTLSLTSNAVVVGAAKDLPDNPDSLLTPLLLAPEFFQNGGFANYQISANRDSVTVADGVALRPLMKNLELQGDYLYLPTGADLSSHSRVVTLNDTLRKPTSLSLTLAQTNSQNRESAVVIGDGASIRADREAAIKLSSDTSIFVNGQIAAPGGSIGLTVVVPAADRGFFASQGIWLGENSLLSAAGELKATPDPLGQRKGEVLPGGTVSLTANRGYIVAARGSRIEAPGAAATLDFWERDGLDIRNVPQTIASNGGGINLTAAEGIIADGTLSARAGGRDAAGGSLSVTINKDLRAKPPEVIPGAAFPDDEPNPANPQGLWLRTIAVSSASDSVMPEGLRQGGDIPLSANGLGLLKQAALADGGFGALNLRVAAPLDGDQFVGAIHLQDGVSLAADRQVILDAPTIGWQPAADTNSSSGVAVKAAYVALGSNQSRTAPDAVAG
ncbi:MAG: filamentous hemagglutinin N-terminal domain-containing protein, partial [Candidatus Methylumidiphilus sp.]